MHYIIENFERLIAPFAETLQYFPVKSVSVITGAGGRHEPISAIHPNAIDKGKNDLIAGVLDQALGLRAGAAVAAAANGTATEANVPDEEDAPPKPERKKE